MDPHDIDIISEIAERYGYSDWALVGFASGADYHVFSYFSDLSVTPVFKAVLISIMKTLDEYMQNCRADFAEAVHSAGTC